MSSSHSKLGGPPTDLLGVQIAARALNSLGVASIAAAIAIALCISLSVFTRTTLGFPVAAVMIGTGEFISRRGGSRAFYCGSTTIATGYALAAFFAQATHYVGAVAGFQSPFPCWLLELALALTATIQLSRNRALRFAALPFTLVVTANVLFHALTSGETITALGMSFGVSALASVVGVLWFAGLTALNQQFEARHSASSADFNERASQLLYRVTHELYFLLAAVNALALPYFVGSSGGGGADGADPMRYAPVWWALETPALLAISWRSKSFTKHALVMGIWALSAVLLLTTKLDQAPLIRMAVPLSGIAMALTYRFVQSSWAIWQKRLGYCAYLYGSVAVAVALPLFQMTPLEALPYWLAQAGAILALAIALKDKLLQRVGTAGGVLTIALFGSQWQHWQWPIAVELIAGCYAFSFVYGYISKKGGLAKSDFVPIPGTQTLSEKEAGYLEIGAAVLGFVTLLATSYLLFNLPYNTIAWGISSFALITLGFLTKKPGHRACGLVAMTMAALKLTIYDLSGAETLLRSLVGFGSICLCCFAAGRFYMVEYARVQRRRAQQEAEKKAKESQPDQNQGGQG